MGSTSSIREFVDCCFCTHRDLKASHNFGINNEENNNEGNNIIEIKYQDNEENSSKDLSFTNTEFPSEEELKEFNEKFHKKLENYNQIPKKSIILYKSGFIE